MLSLDLYKDEGGIHTVFVDSVAVTFELLSLIFVMEIKKGHSTSIYSSQNAHDYL